MEKEYLLYQKASAEYKELIMRIEKLSGKEALECAYEKVIKQDILSVCRFLYRVLRNASSV